MKNKLTNPGASDWKRCAVSECAVLTALRAINNSGRTFRHGWFGQVVWLWQLFRSKSVTHSTASGVGSGHLTDQSQQTLDIRSVINNTPGRMCCWNSAL
jgi:hypothetical protein